MNRAYLGLGTNIGERIKNLKSACEFISDNTKIKIINMSKVYETKAWGYTDQDDFLNMCIEIETSLNEFELLDYSLEVEQKLHRERTIRWGPRTIDIDILFFNDIILNDEKLQIPHPRIKERAFVLVPLVNLNESLKIENSTIKKWLDNLTQEEKEEVSEKEVLKLEKR